MRYLILLSFLVGNLLLRAQTPTANLQGDNSAKINQTDSLPLANTSLLAIGYGQQPISSISSAITQVNEEDFNTGLISDPLLLVQGRIAGMQVYNRGGDPNRSSLIRVRGAALGANPAPLIVIDGIVATTLDQVDPNDIADITLLKDASATVIYGMRASAGVLMVRTKNAAEQQDGWRVSYRGQGAASTLSGEVPVLNAAEYLAEGGSNLGSSTDWLDAVTRTGWSQVHALALSHATANTQLRFATNYRNIEGILRHSGFEQINNRLKFTTQLIPDRLKIALDAAFTLRTSDYSFPEAFRYAALQNPTAPIQGADAPLPFDSEQFGGYFEVLGVFDNYNPVAMLEQNSQTGRRSGYALGLWADFQLTDEFSITARTGQQANNFKERAIYPGTSYYRGNAISATRKGRAYYLSSDQDFDLYEVFATYTRETEPFTITALAGYSQQRLRSEYRGLSLERLANTDYDFLASYDPPGYSGADSPSLVSAFQTLLPDDKINAFFTRLALDWKTGFFANLSIRGEHPSVLGTMGDYFILPAIGVGVDFKRLGQLDHLEQFRLRAAYGLTMGILTNAAPMGLNFISTADGTIRFEVIDISKIGLMPERQSEFNLGLDFATSRFAATFDIYRRKVKELVVLPQVDPIFSVEPDYENLGTIHTLGAELSLGYQLINNKALTWQTSLLLSTNRTILDQYYTEQELRANLGAPGQNGVLVIRPAEGEEIGQIWGPVFAGLTTEGAPVFTDLNKDGQIIGEAVDALDPNADFRVIGNGRPDLEFGWSHRLRLGNWSMTALFRGALGHSLVNTFRLFYEPRTADQNSYNVVDTELAVDGLTVSRFSSLYVERADFLKLDNITLAREFPFKRSGKSLTISLTGQNLWVWTNYTGPDPEPALVDYGPASNGAQVDYGSPDNAAPGIDRRYNYWPGRTVSLGIKVSL